MSKKFLYIDHRRIPCPKCIVCQRRYLDSFREFLNGKIDVPICMKCNFDNTEKQIEEIVVDRLRELFPESDCLKKKEEKRGPNNPSKKAR